MDKRIFCTGGIMNLRKKCIGFCVLAICALSLCTKVEYSNPLDREGTTYKASWGDSALADDNGDGIANYFDTNSTWYRNHEGEIHPWSMPTITFTGGDTVLLPQNDPNGVVPKLKDQAVVTDSIPANFSGVVQIEGTVYSSKCTTYTLVYSVTNKAHVTARKNRTVIVDCSGPVITLQGNNPDSIVFGTSFLDPGYSAVDNIDGTIPPSSIVKAPATLNTSLEHTDTITYTAYDRVGNKGTAQRVVVIYKPIIRDTTAPVITLLGSTSITLKVGDSFSDPGFTATDDIDLDIQTRVVRTGEVNTMVAGTYFLSYNVSDRAGNPAPVKTRIVTVTDIKADSTPTISLKGKNPDSVKVLVGGTYTDPGCTATDPSGDLTTSVKVTELFGKPLPISTSSIGAYVLVYTVTGATGKIGTATRYVYIVPNSTDNVAPNIYLLGAQACTLLVGVTYVDAGATASDNIDGVITSKIKATLTTAAGAAAAVTTFTSTAGAYKMTYTVTDNAGNNASPKIRNILVEDTTGRGANLTIKYGVPLKTALPPISNIKYSTITVDGKGAPNMSNVRTFTMSWDGTGLYGFDFQYNAAPNYLSFAQTLKHTFGKPQPQFTITNTQVTGLDGTYYINASATQCAWVKLDGTFAIVFKP